MNNRYVVSLELARKLKAAKVPQESEWYWILVGEKVYLSNNGPEQEESVAFVSAPHVGELVEMMPKSIRNNDKRYYFLMIKGGCGYFPCRNSKINIALRSGLASNTDENITESLGKLLLYLLEHKLILPSDLQNGKQ